PERRLVERRHALAHRAEERGGVKSTRPLGHLTPEKQLRAAPQRLLHLTVQRTPEIEPRLGADLRLRRQRVADAAPLQLGREALPKPVRQAIGDDEAPRGRAALAAVPG